ncbi:hypothetical protein ACFOJ6_23175 [Gordonia humi]|uniref:hypothetical protein n=1 Tax=Gordonia humi TaxID=686429 RepID=UPI00361C462E
MHDAAPRLVPPPSRPLVTWTCVRSGKRVGNPCTAAAESWLSTGFPTPVAAAMHVAM